MLTYDLERRGQLARYDYLYRCIKGDIFSGTLAAGEKLPSKRALAENLNVSRITVENAYQQLLTEGYLQSRPRSGYYAEVLETLPQPVPPPKMEPAAPAEGWFQWALDGCFSGIFCC